MFVKCLPRVLGIFLAISTCFAPYLFAQADPGQELNSGTQALRKGKYQEAAEHFERFVALAPQNAFAHLDLAAAYAGQVVPGVDSPDNDRLAEKAIEQYQYAIDSSPMVGLKVNGAKGIGYLYLQMKKFDKAKDYYEKAVNFDPKDPEPYFSIAVIDWTVSYQFRQQERDKLQMRLEDSLPARNKNVCAEVRDKNAGSVQDGIDNLSTALQLRPNYDDAMAYMNLLYRERADIQCDDSDARANDLKTADEWGSKAMAIKQAQIEEAKAREAKAKEAKARAAAKKKADQNSEPPANPQ